MRSPFPCSRHAFRRYPLGKDSNCAACEQLKAVQQLEFMDHPSVPCASFSSASLQGLCVTEAKPEDKKAIAELEALVEAICRVGEKSRTAK